LGAGELGFWLWKAGAISDAPAGAAEPYARQIRGEWADAAAAWEAIGAPFERALALADGDDDATRTALEILDSLGAAPAARRVRRELRAAGAAGIPRGPNTATRASPLGLTPRQAEVLDLMVEGLGNGEIAERLVVSKKTVEHHVSAVLQRLGADSRHRAIAIAVASRAET